MGLCVCVCARTMLVSYYGSTVQCDVSCDDAFHFSVFAQAILGLLLPYIFQGFFF